MLKPQMGWSSWNCFRERIDEDKIMGIAQAMRETGLQALGYEYINIDDCWQSSMRDAQGALQFDEANFPSGPKIIDKLHALNFKVGLYSACSDLTCEDLPGSFLKEKIDADTFAKWGIDYLKYDYCHVVDMPCDCTLRFDTVELDYISIANENHKQRFYPSTEAVLSQGAKIKKDPDCVSQHYIYDLNLGSCNFTHIEVKNAGSYLLTIGYHKYRTEKGSVLQIKVNDQDEDLLVVPRSSGWSKTGRQQVRVHLEAGVNTIKLFNQINSQKADAKMRYERMGRALQHTNRDIFYSISEHGRTEPWTWAHAFVNSWRITPDIEAHWDSVYACYEQSVLLHDYQKPGAYHDPDTLQIGNGDLTYQENRSHFALWCFINAPLLLGFDLRNKPQEVIDIISNPHLISINQDDLLMQAKRVFKDETVDVLVKELYEGKALCILNKKDHTIDYDLSEILIAHDLLKYKTIQDLWTGASLAMREVDGIHKIEGKACLVFKFL